MVASNCPLQTLKCKNSSTCKPNYSYMYSSESVKRNAYNGGKSSKLRYWTIAAIPERIS
jgi:hypothetical protein